MSKFEELLDIDSSNLLMGLRQIFIREPGCDPTTKMQAAFFTHWDCGPTIDRNIEIAGLSIEVHARGHYKYKSFLTIENIVPEAEGNFSWLIGKLIQYGFKQTKKNRLIQKMRTIIYKMKIKLWKLSKPERSCASGREI